MVDEGDKAEAPPLSDDDPWDWPPDAPWFKRHRMFFALVGAAAAIFGVTAGLRWWFG